MELLRADPDSEADAKLAMEMRNDPSTLNASFHKQPERWPEFMEKFRRHYFADPSLPCMFGVAEGAKVGLVRFAPYALAPYRGHEDKTCNISIMIAPQHRGRGCGTALVAAGTRFAHGAGWQTIVAEILPENEASVRMFRRCGYQPIAGRSFSAPDNERQCAVLRFAHAAPREA